MKKLITLMCALLITCSAVTAFADHLYKPNTPETLKALIRNRNSFGVRNFLQERKMELANYLTVFTQWKIVP